MDKAQGPGICRLPRLRPLCFFGFRFKPASSRQPSLLTSLIHNKYLFPWQMEAFGAISGVNVSW